MLAPITTEPTLILAPPMRAPAAGPQQIGAQDPDEVILAIEGVQARLVVRLNDEAILGRNHQDNALQPQIDLVPFGGITLGVSRIHTAIRHDAGGWWLIDLGSSNGTWLNGHRLAPHNPALLDGINNLSLAKMDVRLLLPIDHPNSVLPA